MTSTSDSNTIPRDSKDFFASARKLIKGYTWYGTYQEACALVMGYDEGLGRGTIVGGFQRWISSRTGGQRKVVFWVHVLREAFPELPSPDPSTFSREQHARAVDYLFALLLEYLDDKAAT